MTSVVVGFDGSDESRRALERAASLAGDGEVTVVTATHVAPIATKGPGVVVPDPVEAEERAHVLHEGQTWLAERGVKVRGVEVAGDAADAIIDMAKEVGAEFVVVGTRGRHGAARLLLGSVSSKVAAEAPCDVVVVH